MNPSGETRKWVTVRARAPRIKVINANGEFPGAAKLAEAAVSVQLGCWQTMPETPAARNTTSLFHPDGLA